MTPAIRTVGLSKTYRLGFLMNRTVKALQPLDLQVEPGQVFGVLGPNGAGKSTTLKMLLNLVRPSSGTAELFGVSAARAQSRTDVGFLPENPAPYDYLSGREFVRMCGQLRGLSGARLEAETEDALRRVEMTRTAHLHIRRYSKGMVQRVALAQTLLGKPRLIILDEPSSGLDPVGRRQLRDLVIQERDRGATIMLCTHIIPDVEALCDRVAVLVGGKLVKEGKLSELLASGTSQVETCFENTTAASLNASGVPIAGLTTVADRLVVRTDAEGAQALVRQQLAAGARLVGFTPVRHSLEELFLSTLQGQPSAVGGELS